MHQDTETPYLSSQFCVDDIFIVSDRQFIIFTSSTQNIQHLRVTAATAASGSSSSGFLCSRTTTYNAYCCYEQ